MTLEEIREAFETAEWELPTEALCAAASRARELAPAVNVVCADAAAGVYLLPRQDRFLFFGLYALGAARETSVYPTLLRLLERPESELETVFGFDYMGVATRLLLSMFDGNADPLYALIERLEIDGGVRSILFDVLARLVWEGRADRARYLDFLDRIDREAPMPVDDFAWFGWENAVMLLGLRQFEERVQRGWQAGRGLGDRDVDRQDWALRLARAIEAPERFVDEQIAPIDDPVDALGRLARHAARPDPSPGDPDDPAIGVRLTRAEIHWLDGFLTSGKAPNAMPLEQIDGFFTSLLCGPRPTVLAEHIAQIWDTQDEPPSFDSDAQREHVMALLVRHWAAIEARLEQGFRLVPIIDHDSTGRAGQGWGAGFAEAIDADPDPWEPLLEHRSAGALVAAVTALEYDRDVGDKPLSATARADILRALPTIPLRIRRFWVAPHEFSAPVRVTKVGRNDPCPCGSGRKYKKCCGAGRPPAA
ncbi:MAG: UPF0149 family protein [Proteobacteria bacterium]|nr:UPF0149 family protein [Pseudomonadota bacterium]